LPIAQKNQIKHKASMSKTSKSVLVFAVAFGGIISLNAQTTLLDMTFDNPSTPGMSTDYIQNTAPGTPGNFNTPYGTSVNATLTTFSEQPGVGVYEGGSPSGGIAVAGGDGDAVYSGTGFDFSQAGEWMQLSMMLYTPANGTLTGSGDKFQLGLAYDTQDAPFGGALGNGIINSFASYRLLSVQSTLQYTLEYQNDTGGGSSTQGSGLRVLVFMIAALKEQAHRRLLMSDTAINSHLQVPLRVILQ
jgi:hypothetical protein